MIPVPIAELSGKLLEHSHRPDFAELLSFEMYAAWATEELLQPGNLVHYVGKVREEERELFAAEGTEQIIEEAGDFIWTLAAGRELAVGLLKSDDEPDYFGASMQSIENAWDFSALSDVELSDWVKNRTYLYRKKLKLAAWVWDTASPETKKEYISGVIEGLLPRLIAGTCAYVQRRTGQGISDILRVNMRKLEARIAAGGLDKAIREAAAQKSE